MRVRLTEILTTASAVANFKGEPEVRAGHLLSAIAMLVGEQSLDDLGRPVSPLVARMTGAGSGASAGVRELAQRWFSRQGGEVTYELTDEELHALREELTELASVEAAEE